MNTDDQDKLKAAVGKLQLVLWLREKGVEELGDLLIGTGVVSMKDLCKLKSEAKLKVCLKQRSGLHHR